MDGCFIVEEEGSHKRLRTCDPWLLIQVPLFRFSMTKKVTCDGCGKDHPEDNSYEFKCRASSTGYALVQDLCHPCFMKAVETLGLQKVWKQWNQNSKKWVAVPNA